MHNGEVMTALTVLFGMVTVASFLAALRSHRTAVRFQQENRKLHRERYRYSWADIQQGVSGLSALVKERGFIPDIILTVTGSGAIVANLYTKITGKRVPIFHAMIEDPADRWDHPPRDHTTLETGRWIVHMPESLLHESRDRNLLFLDSSFLSGSNMRNLKRFLLDKGFKNILTACLLRLPLGKMPFQPDLHYYENPTTELYYPWGKA